MQAEIIAERILRLVELKLNSLLSQKGKSGPSHCHLVEEHLEEWLDHLK